MPSEESVPSTRHCRTAEGFRLGRGALSDLLNRLASDGGKPILKVQSPAQLLEWGRHHSQGKGPP